MLTTDNYHYRLDDERRQQIVAGVQRQRLVHITRAHRPNVLLKQVAQWILSAVNVMKYLGLLLMSALILAASPQFSAAAQDIAVFNPNGDEAYHPALVQYRVAHYYFVIGDYERAVEGYSHAIELLPDFSYSYAARGDAHAAMQRYDLAIADYTQAIAIYPAYARIYYQRGLAYYAVGDPANAFADLRHAAEFDPHYAILYRQIGKFGSWVKRRLTMELACQSHTRLHIPRIAIGIQLPVRVRFIIGLWLGLLVMVMSTLLVKPVTPLPPNPFSAYGALLDDQAGIAAMSQDFACTGWSVGYAQINISALCEYRPAAGPFERVEVIISGDYHAEQITFTVRENALTVGDLALLWGRPPIITTANEQMTVDWPGADWSILANTEGNRFSYLKPVYRITFLAAS